MGWKIRAVHPRHTLATCNILNARVPICQSPDQRPATRVHHTRDSGSVAPLTYARKSGPVAEGRSTSILIRQGDSDVCAQETQSGRSRIVTRAKMYAVSDWRPATTDMMSPCDQHSSRHGCAPSRSRRIASASDPLSAAAVHELSLKTVAAKDDQQLHDATQPSTTQDQPSGAFVAERLSRINR